MSASGSAPRASTRLAPGRRRLSPDDTFHRIDPTLHEEATLHSMVGTSGDKLDRLSDFARQVIEQSGDADGDADEHEVDDDLFHPADMTELLDGNVNADMDGAMDGTNVDAAPLATRQGSSSSAKRGMGASDKAGDKNERTRSHSTHEQEHDQLDEEGEDEHSPEPGSGRGSKRSRKAYPPLGPGQTRDPVQMKKDSHKEVERRRREAINDGILDIQRLLPNLKEKAGKGSILRSAAEYIEDLQKQLGISVPGNSTKQQSSAGNGLASDSEQLQHELNAVTAQLADEHARSLGLETSWRDAEDRAAQNQFELERVKAELNEAKMQLLEKRR